MYFVSSLVGPNQSPMLTVSSDDIGGPVSIPYTPYVVPNDNYTGLLPVASYTYTPDNIIELVDTVVGRDSGQIYMPVYTRVLDFGLVLTDTTFTVDITNLTIDSVEIISVSWLSDIGITTTLTAGTTLAKSQSTEFEITASATIGRASVDSIFTITFDNGSTLTIDLYILRVSSLVYSLIPDRRSYSEAYVYKTEIVEFTTGTESRRQLMTVPKREISYSVTLTDPYMTEYSKSIAQLSMYTVFAQPLWFYRAAIQGPHLTSSIISFDTTDKPFEVGGYCAVIGNQLHPILLRIVAVNSDHIQVDTPFKLYEDFHVIPAIPMYNSKTISNQYDSYSTNTVKYTLKEL